MRNIIVNFENTLKKKKIQEIFASKIYLRGTILKRRQVNLRSTVESSIYIFKLAFLNFKNKYSNTKDAFQSPLSRLLNLLTGI